MNWESILDDYNIPYVTRGPNTKRGEISIRCPWCGEDDPSEHLGINLTTENWGCHRDSTHRGKSSGRLIQRLLGCSLQQAKLILAQYNAVDPDTLEQAIAALGGAPEPTKTQPPATLPPEFRPIQAVGSTRRFWDYLAARGFKYPDKVCDTYGLLACSVGRYKDRIIIPVLAQKRLIGWTSRAIQRTTNAPRYLASNSTIKSVIYNGDAATSGGHLLVITEGPFDALKIDHYGWPHAVAVCTFGTSSTDDQKCSLRELSNKFDKTVVLYDKDAVGPAFELTEWLPKATTQPLPTGIKDPGELTQLQVRHLIKSWM